MRIIMLICTGLLCFASLGQINQETSDLSVSPETHFNITAEGERIPLTDETDSFEDRLFWVDQDALDEGIVDILGENPDRIPDHGNPVLVDGATLKGGTSYPIISTNSFYYRNGYFIIRMTCTPGSMCTKTLTFQNYGSAAGTVTFARNWGSSTYAIVSATGCSGSSSGGNASLTLSPGASCQVNVSAQMPSGYAQYWEGSVIINGVQSPTSGYFDICMSHGDNYCK